MKKQNGFTLIELVIVIIILGILAATAVPKFVDLQGDARKSAMKGVKGALEGAATLTFSRATIDGKEKDSNTVNGVKTLHGYPEPNKIALEIAAGLAATDWEIIDGTDEAVIIAEGAPDDAETSGNAAECRVVYAKATSIARPTIKVHDDGC